MTVLPCHRVPLAFVMLALPLLVGSACFAPMGDDDDASDYPSSSSGGHSHWPTSNRPSSGSPTSHVASSGSPSGSGHTSGSGEPNSGSGASGSGYQSVTETPDGGWADAGQDAGNPGTLISFGGAQDFAYFRMQVLDGGIPLDSDMDPTGFFAEHHTPLPPPDCGDRNICVHAMAGAHPGLAGVGGRVLMQVGLNSRLRLSDLPRLPRRLMLVIDASGSMRGRNMDMVIAALTLLGRELTAEDQWGLVTFGDGAEEKHPLESFNQVDWADTVAALEGNAGATNIGEGLQKGLALLGPTSPEDLSRFQHRLILLSDGMANRGITDREELVSSVVDQLQQGVGLTTVGVGWQFDPVLMRRLAEEAGGTFFFADSQRALQEIFVEELRTFVVPVGYQINVRVEAGPCWDLRAAWGAPGFNHNSRFGEVTLKTVTLAHRVSHGDHAAGRRGGGSALLLEMMRTANPPDGGLYEDLGQATLTYLPAAGDTLMETQRVVYAPGSEEIPENGYWTQPLVEKSFLMLALYLAFTQAAVDAHSSVQPDGGLSGPPKAVADLDAMLATAGPWVERLQDDDLADDLAIMRRLRENITRSLAP